jgi:hypothetical protein
MGCCDPEEIFVQPSLPERPIHVSKKKQLAKDCQFDYIKEIPNKYKCIRCNRLSGIIDPQVIKPKDIAANCSGKNLIGDGVENFLRIIYVHQTFKLLFKRCGCEYRKFLLNKLDRAYGLTIKLETAKGLFTGYLLWLYLLFHWCGTIFKSNRESLPEIKPEGNINIRS